MGIKETPINFRIYYKLFIKEYSQKLEDTKARKEELLEEIRIKHDDIEAWLEVYKTDYNIDLNDFEEYKQNKYITGKFYRTTKGLFINKTNNYELIADLFNLYDLASKQKEIHDCDKNIEFYTKCANINIREYCNILRIYYTEVQKKMILEGKGYSFSNNIGWMCINRFVFEKKKKIVDYVATKKRTKELLAQGKRIYNKEEAEWCKKNGIKYEAEDKRVFICNEHAYQFLLLYSKLTHGDDLKLDVADYRHKSLRGKSQEEIIELCGRDTKKICELPMDMKAKMNMCDKVDKLLYTKLIRNENQKPLAYGKACRQNRQ